MNFNGIMTEEIARQVTEAGDMMTKLDVLDSQIGNVYDEFVRGGINMQAMDFAKAALSYRTENKIAMEPEMWLNFATHRMNLILMGMA
jgi:methyl coenzyme M reductase gamma subunit